MLAIFAVLGLATIPVAAQVPPGGVPIPTQADFGDPEDFFGAEIEVDGEWAIVTGLSREAYYVYQRVDGLWTRRQRIVPPTLGQAGLNAIDLRGNRLLIARAFGEGYANQGRVWVYERSAPGTPFALAATLTPDSGQAGDRFGYGLDQSDDRIFVGASGRQESVANQGAVYVFVRSGANWVQEAKLLMPDPTVADRYGFGLAFDGQDLLVGARQHRPTGGAATRRGAVYIYRLQSGTWTQVQKLEQPLAVTQGTQFGYAVSAANGRAAITGPGGGVAAVYLAERDAGGVWTYITLPTPLAGTGRVASFIDAIDLDGDLVAAAVPSVDAAAPNAPGPGYAVVWARLGGVWTLTAALQRPDGVLTSGARGTNAGGVRLGAGWMLVGAPRDNASAGNPLQGSVLSYSLVNGVATPRQRIWHGSGNRPDNLGAGVGIDGDHAAVIAPGADAVDSALDRGALHFLRRDGAGGWSFVQTIAGTPDSGTPTAVAVAGDHAYVNYPDASTAGLPAPAIRVFRRDVGGAWTALCDLLPPVGTTQAIEALRASALGALAVMDGNRVAWWPAPAGASCPAGALLPVASTGGHVGANLKGTVASLEWEGPVNGAVRRGLDIYDFGGGSWTLAQSFTASGVNGLSAESFEIGMPDGANRLLAVHRVPVSTIDRRFDVEIWTRPAPGSPFTLTRTFVPPTATGGYDGGFFVGDLVAFGDDTIGLNGGVAVFDPATGVRLQSLVPPGLTVEDETVDAADFTGSRGILGVSRQNRAGVNHAGMVYLVEPTGNRGTPALLGTVVPVALPPAGGDSLFFDGMENAGY